MNHSYRAFVKELNNDMDKFQNTSIISEYTLIHKSIIMKLVPTRLRLCH